MQISAAMRIASSAICAAVRLVCLASARAAESANAPPEPMARMPSSGWISGAGDEVGPLVVGHDEHGLQLAQVLVHAPVLRQLDDGALHVAAVLLELGLETGEEREGVRGGAGETSQDFVVVEAAHFCGAVLHDRVADRDLPVAGHRYLAIAANAEDGRCVKDRGFHSTADPISAGRHGRQPARPAAWVAAPRAASSCEGWVSSRAPCNCAWAASRMDAPSRAASSCEGCGSREQPCSCARAARVWTLVAGGLVA